MTYPTLLNICFAIPNFKPFPENFPTNLGVNKHQTSTSNKIIHQDSRYGNSNPFEAKNKILNILGNAFSLVQNE